MQQANTTATTSFSSGENFNLNDFLSFKTMVTLRIIQIMYAVVAIIITIGALIVMFKGNSRSSFGAPSLMPGGFFGGLLLLVFGNVIWRVWCELMIVIFRINKSLTNIEKNNSLSGNSF